ncbi:MAG: cation:proton antiporter, partial [Rhodanobacteraceae bacterium]
VVLLVFTLGLDFNLRKRRALGAGVMLAALVEAGLMLWMGVEIGRLAGLAPREALFLGGVICFSSTMIALRTAADRGWRGQGFVAGMVGMRVSEEVLTVVLITVLSAVAAGNANTTGVAFHVLWRMLLFVAVALVIGLLLDPSQLLPWLLPALGLALAVIVGKTLACSVGAFLCAESLGTRPGTTIHTLPRPPHDDLQWAQDDGSMPSRAPRAPGGAVMCRALVGNVETPLYRRSPPRGRAQRFRADKHFRQ